MKVFKALLIISLMFGTCYAEEETPEWLEGVELGIETEIIAPFYAARILCPDGGQLPREIPEDTPFLFQADSPIFGDPPTEFRGEELPNAVWMRDAHLNWVITDHETRNSFGATTSVMLPANQMYVTIPEPSEAAAVCVYMNRLLQYDLPCGDSIETFAQSSIAFDIVVTDITPPTCGFALTTNRGKGSIWPVESPVNIPAPKLADIFFLGNIFCSNAEERDFSVDGINLGTEMIVPSEKGAIYVSADDEIKVELILNDNYKLDEESVVFGISDSAGSSPNIIGEKNSYEINLSEIEMPEEPWLFIQAFDEAENEQLMYIRLIMEN